MLTEHCRTEEDAAIMRRNHMRWVGRGHWYRTHGLVDAARHDDERDAETMLNIAALRETAWRVQGVRLTVAECVRALRADGEAA